MSFIIEDLDAIIMSFMDLPETVNLMQTNTYYYEKIKQQDLIKEWDVMKQEKNGNPDNIFAISCANNYMTYAKSLIKRYKINIHFNHERAFRDSCLHGNILVAKWLIDLGENHGYGQINIHTTDVFTYTAFICACSNGHLKIAKWLINLGENHGFGKINIHRNHYFNMDNAFEAACFIGHLKIAKWLINLGENHGYGKINIRLKINEILTYSIGCRYFDLAKWLIELMEHHGY